MGLLITFDDKSTIKEDSTPITHDKRGDGSAMRSAFLPITESNIGKLTTKKIVKFSLAGNNKEVPADLAATIQQYLVCLKNVKKMP
ncbi:MAG: hypothetical protein EBZ77_12835, partial [Chitinophagia bacterium]|nr:hypothetical protein [Chitinophagia bacterium]